jgi:hypothetical protein
VEEPACYTSQPAVSIADFSALYERCVASGLKARVVFGHVAGIQTITVTCNLPASSAAATTGARRRRRQRRRRVATTMGACTEGNSTDIVASATAATAGGNAPTPPSPEAVSPPPKRIWRQRNEVELLRGAEGEDDLLLSPLSCTSPPPPLPSPSPFRALTLYSALPLPPPSAPLDHVPASPPTCPPTPPERPESPPQRNQRRLPRHRQLPTRHCCPLHLYSQRHRLHCRRTRRRLLLPPHSPGYTIVFKWCPSCKKSLMDNREFECYAFQDRRYYCSMENEQE